jgi:protein TonB
MVFLGAVVFQVLLGYALANGLVSKVRALITGPMKTDIIEEQKVVRTAPPPPKPDFKALPPPTVITPDFAIEAPAPAPSSSAIREDAHKQAAAPVVQVPPRSNPRHPVPPPEYPPTSKRLGETGTVVLLLTVDENGKVVEAEVKKSSGFDRLDEAAKEQAMRDWRLLPGTVGGKPTKMTYPFAVTFKITD